MIYKKRMHPLILLVISLALCSSEDITIDKNASQNPVKRFNLQDLLGQQNIQISGGDDKDAHLTSSKTQTIDVQELLAAAQKAAANKPQAQQPKQEEIISKFVDTKPKSVDIDITADKNGNFNLENIPGLTSSAATHDSSVNMNELQSIFSKPKEEPLIPSAAVDQNNVVREEINLGKQKLEIEAAGKRATRYTLAKGPDGGLNLIPIVNDDASSRTLDYMQPNMQPKEYEEKGRSRQQMQLTTLSQALYSPFPSDANILHLHLKGKDGKDGKAGNKGPMGPIGPKGPEGPKGPKGDAGTCSSQINGLFECTPDELDSLSNRVDYLEKICKKVENAAKKHSLVHSNNKSSSTSSSPTTSSTKSEVSKTEHTTKKDENTEKSDKTEKSEKESSSVKETKEKTTTTEKETEHATKEKESAKEMTAKEKEDAAREKEIREEVIARLKEKEALKIEKEIEENGVTRGKKDEGESTKIKEDKEKEKDEKPKEKEKEAESSSKKEKVAPKQTEKVKEKDDKEDEEKSEKKDTEPIIRLNKDGAAPTERSMIDIKAKLKIAELDLMDRVNQAKAGAKSS